MSNHIILNISGTFDRQLGDVILAYKTGDFDDAYMLLNENEIKTEEYFILNQLSFDGNNNHPSYVKIFENEYFHRNNDFYFISLTQTFNHLTDTDLRLLIKTFAAHYVHINKSQDVMPLGYWRNEFKSELHLIYPNLCNKKNILSVTSDFY